MARSDAFLQFQADVLGQPIRRSPQTESTALAQRSWPAWVRDSGAIAPRPSRLLESGVHTFTPARDYAWRSRAMERWRRAVETVIGHYHKEDPAR